MITHQTKPIINDTMHDAIPPSHWKQIREEVLGPMKRDKDQVPKKPRIRSEELQIINQEANREDSMKILRENSLRPITYHEAFTTYKEVLIEMARRNGEFWFYPDGQGLDEYGLCILNEKGELKKGRGASDDTVYAYSGKGPLSVWVGSDNGTSHGCRFSLDADEGPDFVVSVVVGVREDSVRE